MELKDGSGDDTGGEGGRASKSESGSGDEGSVEAAIEAEIEADAASYEAKLVGENEFDELEVREEAVAAEESPAQGYPRPYEPPLHPIAKRESLLKRLRPYYLTAAGLLLIGRIVVYSLRRRRR